MKTRQERKPLQYRAIPVYIAMVLVILVAGSPVSAGKQFPTITSVTYQPISSGDSLRLVADGPFPKAFINSGSENVEIEYTGIDCRIPGNDGGTYTKKFDGKLTNHVEVEVAGDPPKTTIALGLSGKTDYSYSYVTHSDDDIEFRITTYSPNQPASQPTPPAQPAQSAQPEPQPQPVRPATPQKVGLPDLVVGVAPEAIRLDMHIITKVEYFPIEGDRDRIEFAFEGRPARPSINILTFPPRLEVIFEDAEVRLPVNNKYGPFLTNVPGKGISRLKAWNRNSHPGGSEFELFLDENAHPSWDVTESADGHGLVLDISYERAPEAETGLPAFSPKPEKVDEPSIEIEAYFIGGPDVSGNPGDDLPPKVVKLQQMEIVLNWPEDAQKLVSQLTQIAAASGPGIVVEIPLKLRLRLSDTGYNVPYPKMEQ